MAKPKITISEKLPENSFTQDQEKLSHKPLVGQCKNDDAKGDADLQTSGMLNPVKRDFLPDDSHHSCDPEVVDTINTMGVEENQDDVEDRKSDYEAESFYSYDSYKGSEMTNVTPRSLLSDCSSLLHSAGVKYTPEKMNRIDARNIGNQHRNGEDGEELSLLGHEMKYLNEKRQAVMPGSQRSPSGRRNMSFSNEELRKIEKDNQLLLNKIMSHQKPQIRTMKPLSGPPRTSSSAINRRKQQKKIEEDNMMLLRRIQSAKSCAIPRSTPPGCRMRM